MTPAEIEKRDRDLMACDVPGCIAPVKYVQRDGNGVVRFKFCAEHSGPIHGPIK